MISLKERFAEIFKFMTRPLSDEMYLKLSFRIRMGRKLDLEKPVTLNEKLQWLKLYYHDPKLNQYVDKYAVKNIVSKVIGNEYIIPTLGMWKSFDEIDFSKLPDKFVLKCNHDSHSVVICKDKDQFNYQMAKSKLTKGLKTNYFWHGREWAYKDVKPCIIAEEYMSDNEQSDVLTDYKFYCFKDYVDSVMLCIDREIGEPKYYFFDKDWKLCRYNVRGKEAPEDFTLPKPQGMDGMFKIASKLSQMTGAPFVRVDLYNVNGHTYFGELTFSPGNGLDPNRLYETDVYFGNLIKLEELKNEKNGFIN